MTTLKLVTMLALILALTLAAGAAHARPAPAPRPAAPLVDEILFYADGETGAAVDDEITVGPAGEADLELMELEAEGLPQGVCDGEGDEAPPDAAPDEGDHHHGEDPGAPDGGEDDGGDDDGGEGEDGEGC
jgi:hypothetical protein